MLVIIARGGLPRYGAGRLAMMIVWYSERVRISSSHCRIPQIIQYHIFACEFVMWISCTKTYHRLCFGGAHNVNVINNRTSEDEEVPVKHKRVRAQFDSYGRNIYNCARRTMFYYHFSAVYYYLYVVVVLQPPWYIIRYHVSPYRLDISHA